MNNDKFDYNKCWQIWDEMKKYGPVSNHMRRLIFDIMKGLEFNSILDIGCGNGLLLNQIKNSFNNINLYGCDISEEAINLAKMNLKQAEFYCFDISKKFIDKKFDLVLCCDVLEHIEDFRHALMNIRKMTENYFLLTTLQGKMRKFERNVGHLRNFNKNELMKDLSDYDFRVLKIIEWGFPFYSPIYRSLFSIKRVEDFSYGRYGIAKKIIASLLYYIFYLNSIKHGDYLIILCKTGNGKNTPND